MLEGFLWDKFHTSFFHTSKVYFYLLQHKNLYSTKTECIQIKSSAESETPRILAKNMFLLCLQVKPVLEAFSCSTTMQSHLEAHWSMFTPQDGFLEKSQSQMRLWWLKYLLCYLLQLTLSVFDYFSSQLDTRQYHQGRGTLKWGNDPIRMSWRQACGVYSWLTILT